MTKLGFKKWSAQVGIKKEVSGTLGAKLRANIIPGYKLTQKALKKASLKKLLKFNAKS